MRSHSTTKQGGIKLQFRHINLGLTASYMLQATIFFKALCVCVGNVLSYNVLGQVM